MTANTTWLRVPLSEIADLTLSSVDKKSKSNEQTVRLCNYMDVYSNSFIWAGLDFMGATATEREIANCSLFAGDVVITKDSEKHDDIGVPALVREDVTGLVCGYHLAILRPSSSSVDGAYLYYALKDAETQQQFHSYANGVTRFGLRKADIGLVEIQLPPLSVQQHIANVLTALDDKIELNRQMNGTLEQMVCTLYKSWFVDFGPVRAKADGWWKRGESLPGLPAEFYDLFPNRLVSAKVGQVPEGWAVRPLKDIATLRGRSVSPKEVDPGTPYVGLDHIPRRSLALAEWSSADEVTSNKAVFERGDILFGKLRPYFHKVVIAPVSGIASTDALVIRPVDDVWSAMVVCIVFSEDFVAYTDRTSTGTKMPRTSWPTMGQYEVGLPPASVAFAFQRMSSCLIEGIVSRVIESRRLASQRDALLPKLISGDLRVTEVNIT